MKLIIATRCPGCGNLHDINMATGFMTCRTGSCTHRGVILPMQYKTVKPVTPEQLDPSLVEKKED